MFKDFLEGNTPDPYKMYYFSIGAATHGTGGRSEGFRSKDTGKCDFYMGLELRRLRGDTCVGAAKTERDVNLACYKPGAKMTVFLKRNFGNPFTNTDYFL